MAKWNAYKNGNKVIIRRRDWDGGPKPEFADICALSPLEAYWLGGQLQMHAQEIEAMARTARNELHAGNDALRKAAADRAPADGPEMETFEDGKRGYRMPLGRAIIDDGQR